MSRLDQLDREGFCLLPSVLDPERLSWALDALERVLGNRREGVLVSEEKTYGVRNLLTLWPEARRLVAETRAREFLQALFGPESQPRLVRGLYFDKPPGKSWTLPWHRDRTVAVAEHKPEAAEAGFTNPTRKAGIAHYIAPDSLLTQMVTLRFSLDPMTSENGPLVVLAGSHQNVEHEQDLHPALEQSIHEVNCAAGDVFIMRPLLAHSSLMSSLDSTQRRRVVHLEFCDQTLPEPLQWYESYGI